MAASPSPSLPLHIGANSRLSASSRLHFSLRCIRPSLRPSHPSLSSPCPLRFRPVAFSPFHYPSVPLHHASLLLPLPSLLLLPPLPHRPLLPLQFHPLQFFSDHRLVFLQAEHITTALNAELAVSSSLAKTLENNTPCIFLLLSSSLSSNRAVHTHVYKAYVLKQGEKPMLEPVSLKVINVGPSSSGGQYGNFSPELSSLPLMPCAVRATEAGHFMNLCSEAGEKKKSKKERSLGAVKEKMQEQKILDLVTDGFGVERLERLVAGPANSYTHELEELYCNMLNKLENLVKQVEKSSVRVSEQENRNLELRCKLAGME